MENVSDDTPVVNAYAAGFGPSKRIVLWDTLVDGFPRRQVEVVLAHEIGHHSSDHIPKGIAWYALFALPGAYLIARLTRRRGGMRSPEAVPLSLLVIAVLQLAALPVTSAITRRMEAEADWKALESTRDPAAARGAFAGSRGRRSATRTRRSCCTCCSTVTRRWRSVSRWPRPGRERARR